MFVPYRRGGQECWFLNALYLLSYSHGSGHVLVEHVVELSRDVRVQLSCEDAVRRGHRREVLGAEEARPHVYAFLLPGR